MATLCLAWDLGDLQDAVCLVPTSVEGTLKVRLPGRGLIRDPVRGHTDRTFPRLALPVSSRGRKPMPGC